MLGVTLVRFANDHTAVDKYIRRALGVFRRAVEAIPDIEEEQNVEMIAKSAFPGRKLAKEFDDDSSLQFFQEAIDRIKAAGNYDTVLQRQEDGEKHDIVNMLNQTDDVSLGSLDKDEFEQYVENLVDHMMESTGWPADRRQHIEDDLRKIRIYEEEKLTYCKHLEPLQDLRHTQHPDTAYAAPTNYVIRCGLLGSRTRIGVTDMNLAISNMKSTFCEGCEHRVPSMPSDPQSD